MAALSKKGAEGFNVDKWIKYNKFMAQVKSENTRKKLTLFKASILSLLFGVVLGIIVIGINGYNGFAFLGEVFARAFSTESIASVPPGIYATINYFSAFVILALGLAVGFRIGLFNIGGSGQAVLGAGLSIFMLGSIASDPKVSTEVLSGNPAFIVLCFIIFVVVATLVSALAGVLKAFLNIHEVVTTVMMNWIAWYVVKWMLTTPTWLAKWPAVSGTQSTMLNPTWTEIAGNPWVLGIILAVVCVGVIFVLLRFTSFGFKFKVVGNAPGAAKYAGIKSRGFLIGATAISGALVGIASFLFYFNVQGNLDFKADVIPDFGFDGISIALVAFNNEFGIIPIAMLWAALKNGSPLAIAAPQFQGLTAEAASLMFGAIIYGAAIASIFMRFEPIKWIKVWMYELVDMTLIEFKKFKHKDIKELKQLINTVNADEEVVKLKEIYEKEKEKLNSLDKSTLDYQELSIKVKKLYENYKFEIKNKKQIYRGKIKIIKNEIANQVRIGYEKYQWNGMKGIKNKAHQKVEIERLATMDELLFVIIKRDQKIDLYQQQYKEAIDNGVPKDIAKSDLNHKIAELKKVINAQSYESVVAFENKKEKIIADFHTKKETAHVQVAEIDINYKEQVASLDHGNDGYKDELFQLKLDRWNNLMGVDK